MGLLRGKEHEFATRAMAKSRRMLLFSYMYGSRASKSSCWRKFSASINED